MDSNLRLFLKKKKKMHIEIFGWKISHGAERTLAQIRQAEKQKAVLAFAGEYGVKK